jgi:NADPH:quinone reductase-like Zn-dependent oxidoreductase
MKAIVLDEYGSPDVLALEEIHTPVPGEGEVLVRVHASSVNPADWHVMRGEPRIARLSFGLRAPKYRVLGCDLAGTVEAVGADVTSLQPGDEVYGITFMRGFGGFAEYASVGVDLLGPKPVGLTYEQAGATPIAAMTALQGLRDHGRIDPGQKVLIIGASGGVGTFAVQIAKSLGAEVTGVCSTRNVDLVRSLGADHVIDYTCEGITEVGQQYDVIFQLAGTRSPSALRRALTAKGTLLLSSGQSDGHWIGPLTRVLSATLLSPFVSQRLLSFTVEPNGEDLDVLRELVEGGKLMPVIDRTYPLSEVPDAIRYLEEGHARGKVAVTAL